MPKKVLSRVEYGERCARLERNMIMMWARTETPPGYGEYERGYAEALLDLQRSFPVAGMEDP